MKSEIRTPSSPSFNTTPSHRFWQFRESGGDTYFETSPDGQNWAIRAQTPTADLFPVDLVQVALGGGAAAGQASPGEVRFDKLNGGGAPKQKYCPMSSLTDDFADGAEEHALGPFLGRAGWHACRAGRAVRH
ncbi:MAG: hypothetical protein IPM54_17615 [Polyangiaceae bacterium]|nr:hypothetical protein [Polyangiaceae bacterium]